MLTLERPMATKKSNKVTYTTAKIRVEDHAKLKVISAATGKDISEILTEIIREPINKQWLASISQLNEQAKGE